MTLLLNQASAAVTNDTVVTTGNSGGAAGSAFDLATQGSGGTLVFDNAHAVTGNLPYGYKIQSTTAAASYVQWNTSMGAQTEVWWAGYFWFGSNPGVTMRLWNASLTSTSYSSCSLNASGLIVLSYFSAGTVFATFTTAVALNQWIRIEGMLIASATVGQVGAWLYNSPFSTVATESHQSTATLDTGASQPTSYNYGDSNSIGSLGPYWIGGMGLSNGTSQIGPFITPSLPPTLLQPVKVRPTGEPPVQGRTIFLPGTYQGTGPQIYPPVKPATALVRILPPRGRTVSQPGPFGGLGPPVTPLRQAVAAKVRILPPRGRTVRVAGPYQGTGPAIRPLLRPVTSPRQLPPRGRIGRIAGIPVIPGSGPAVYPLRAPMQAKLPPSAHSRGRIVQQTGTYTLIIFYDLTVTYGTPFSSWRLNPPFSTWETGTAADAWRLSPPESSWEFGTPGTDWRLNPPYIG
jgi:hypothetical protein